MANLKELKRFPVYLSELLTGTPALNNHAGSVADKRISLPGKTMAEG
jgi:hypothetical protein